MSREGRQPELVRSLTSTSEGQTHTYGQRLGELLTPGDFIGLVGDLGAGKTQFVRGVARGAGVSDGEVASPTFAILYPYRGRLPIYHADLYRLSGVDELYATGFFDVIGAEGAVLVEWLDQIWEAAPDELLVVSLRATEPRFEARDDTTRSPSSPARADPSEALVTTRELTLEAYGGRHAALLETWYQSVLRSDGA